jgi:hypothetical protein
MKAKNRLRALPLCASISVTGSTSAATQKRTSQSMSAACLCQDLPSRCKLRFLASLILQQTGSGSEDAHPEAHNGRPARYLRQPAPRECRDAFKRARVPLFLMCILLKNRLGTLSLRSRDGLTLMFARLDSCMASFHQAAYTIASRSPRFRMAHVHVEMKTCRTAGSV